MRRKLQKRRHQLNGSQLTYGRNEAQFRALDVCLHQCGHFSQDYSRGRMRSTYKNRESLLRVRIEKPCATKQEAAMTLSLPRK